MTSPNQQKYNSSPASDLSASVSDGTNEGIGEVESPNPSPALLHVHEQNDKSSIRSDSNVNVSDGTNAGIEEAGSDTSPNSGPALLHAYENPVVSNEMSRALRPSVSVTSVLMRPLDGTARKSMVELVIVTSSSDARPITTAMLDIIEINGDLIMCDGRQHRSMLASEVDSYDAPYLSTEMGLDPAVVVGGDPLPTITIRIQQLDSLLAADQPHGAAGPNSAERTGEETGNCVICVEQLSGTDIVAKLECGHIFKAPCIISWLSHSSCCPVCRRVLHLVPNANN